MTRRSTSANTFLQSNSIANGGLSSLSKIIDLDAPKAGPYKKVKRDI